MIPLPYSVTNPTRTFPILTVCLILLNTSIYFGGMSGGEVVYLWEQFGFSANHIQPITLITHQFLHGGLMHLIGNMWFLWLFGANLEDLMGKIGYTLYYLAGGVLAALVFKVAMGATLPEGVAHNLIGASGAISAIMGGYFVLFPKSKVKCVFLLGWIPIPFQLPAVFFLGLYFVMQFVMLKSMSYSNVAYTAHIGGFAFGAGVLYLLISTRAVIVPNLEKVKRGEYANIKAEEAFLGRLAAAFEKKQFGVIPELYRGLLVATPHLVFEPEKQIQVARAIISAGDPQLAIDAYRRLMAAAPEHPLSHRAGIDIAKILINTYGDKQTAAAYLQWVAQASGGVGPLNAEALALLQRLSA